VQKKLILLLVDTFIKKKISSSKERLNVFIATDTHISLDTNNQQLAASQSASYRGQLETPPPHTTTAATVIMSVGGRRIQIFYLSQKITMCNSINIYWIYSISLDYNC